MRRPLRSFLLATLLTLSVPAHAQDQRFLDSLRKLEPETRLEQVCDYAAMSSISRDTGRPADRAKSDVTSRPAHSGNTLTVKGGAFRSKGQWFALAFTCKGTPDHLHVASLQYKIGDAIPAANWPSLGLWR